MIRSALVVAVFAAAVGRGGCSPSPYEPCDGKRCGEPCRLCPPDDPHCVETMVVKACDAAGQCAADGTFTCEPPPYDPCAGKRCGELCDPCAPGEPCPMYFAATACDPAGKCVTSGTFTCPAPPDPCAGKRCGDACSTCDPMLGLCPAVMQYCDAQLKCGYAIPVCP